MSQKRVCDLDGRVIDPLTDIFYTITSGRDGVTRDVCYPCSRSRSASAWVQWMPNTDKKVGDRVRDDAYNSLAYDVITAGTTGSTEPVWPLFVGQQVTDGTVVYMTSETPQHNVQVWALIPGSQTQRTLSLWGWMSDSNELAMTPAPE